MLANGELKHINTAQGTACKPLAPQIKSAGDCCCPIRGCNDCEPRVRLKDYIRLKPAIEETCFTIGDDTCEAEVMPAHLHCFEAKIYRRGKCDCVLTIKPTRATTKGAVCFTWPEAFWNMGDGRYEMDIGFDGVCSVVVGLDVIGCHQAVLGYEHAHANACSVIPHCAPQIEDEPYTDNTDCEPCNA